MGPSKVVTIVLVFLSFSIVSGYVHQKARKPVQQPPSSNTYVLVVRIQSSDIQYTNYHNVTSSRKLPQIHCQSRTLRNGKSRTVPRVSLIEAAVGPLHDGHLFHRENYQGHTLRPGDIISYIMEPVSLNTKTSLLFNLGLVGMNRIRSRNGTYTNSYSKLGRAQLDIDPLGPEDHGRRRLRIVSGLFVPRTAGYLHVEYLIVRKPVALAKINTNRRNWLNHLAQLDVGHRGAGAGCRADLPGAIIENTVASLNYIARHGATMAELDVMLTKDGVPIVYHDFDLKNQRGNFDHRRQISQMTLSELRSLPTDGLHDKDCDHNRAEISRAGSLSRSFPTLEEVLKLVDRRLSFQIEVKWPDDMRFPKLIASYRPGMNDFIDRILNCLERNAHDRPIMFATFDPDAAVALRLKQSRHAVLLLTTGTDPELKDTQAVSRAIKYADAFNLAGISLDAERVSVPLVSYAHDRNLLVFAWGEISTSTMVQSLKSIGLDGVIYDKLDLIKPAEG